MSSNITAKRQRLIGAATNLITMARDGGASPQHHRTLLCGGPPLPGTQRDALGHGAQGIGADVVYLAFGPGSPAKGPRRIEVGITSSDGTDWYRDCVFWSARDEAPIVVVPRGGDLDCHFAFDGVRLERREGRPAPSLAAGMIRADARLREGARASLSDQDGKWLAVGCSEVA